MGVRRAVGRKGVGWTVLALLVVLGGPAPSRAVGSAWVRDTAEFQAAVAALRDSGGTIRLRRGRYGRLVVPPRSAGRLRIVGTAGVRVGGVLFDRTQHVSLERVVISPVGDDATVELRGSHDIVLDRVLVSAQGTNHAASVFVPDSWDVTIGRSTFTHCGDRSPEWANCLLLYRWSRNVTVEDSWFHDCLGCDFVHGRFGANLTLRRNRFERALPCSIGVVRCAHQDLVELFAGRGLRVVRNHFGLYKWGGAQLYITGPVDDVAIVNNVFVGVDRRVPGYRSRIGLVIGAHGSERLPRSVRVLNNTILTGAARSDGYAGSLRISRAYQYGGYPKRVRPLIANNVIGLLRTSGRVCNGARASVSNVIVRGYACSGSDQVGSAYLDRRFRPTARSLLLIDLATPRYAPRRDFRGRRRDRRPDVGAHELSSGESRRPASPSVARTGRR